MTDKYSRPGSGETNYRAEIDGLRALAVLSVVAFHAYPEWVPGGFIGVDIFFVISGFLISSHIFTGLSRADFSFADFFGRRIRRIFPALIIVLASSLAFGWLVLFPQEYSQLGKHVTTSTLFFVNFVFVNESGYFDNAAEAKPLLHLWSLAVEEQFYIIWPIALWFAWNRRLKLIYVTIFLLFISLLTNILMANTRPIEIFFWPFGRAWELLAGAMLAWININGYDVISIIKLRFKRYVFIDFEYFEKKSNHKSFYKIFSISGFSLILYGMMFISKDLNYPSQWTIIPVVGTLLIVMAGNKSWFNRAIFMNPVAIWFGQISYPLYLWHWPILSFLLIVEGRTPSPLLRFIAVVLSVNLAYLTYYFIEKRIRNIKISNRLSIVILSILLMNGLFGYLAFRGYILPQSAHILSKKISTNSGYIYPDEQSMATHLPQSFEDQQECFKRLGIPSSSKIRYCQISSDTEFPKVALIGDSHSAAAFKGTAYYLEKEHNVSVVNLAGRLFSNVINAPKGDTFAIDNYLGGFEVADYLFRHKEISTIIMMSRGFWYLDWADNFSIPGNPLKSKEDVYVQGVKDLIDRFPDRRIIFVLENPTLNFNPKICGDGRPIKAISAYFKYGPEFDCTISRNYDDAIHKKYIGKMLALLKNYPNVVIIDPRDVLCDLDRCSAMQSGRVIYEDLDHLNENGSLIQGKQISEAFD